MAQFRKKPVVIEAITFDELVEYGKGQGVPLYNGMPWSFQYKGQPITHENDQCYLICTLEGIMKFTPDDMLITGVNGEIYPCKGTIFAKTYEHVGLPQVPSTEEEFYSHWVPRIMEGGLSEAEAQADVEIALRKLRFGPEAPLEETQAFLSAEVVRKYLDDMIRFWRGSRKQAQEDKIESEEVLASHYIDAFQSVRMTLFDSVLPVEEV